MSTLTKTFVKNIKDLIKDDSVIPANWNGVAVINEDNMTYVAWNEKSKEAVVVDPMREDWNTLIEVCKNQLEGYRFVAVIDTHTHADHVSNAAQLAQAIGASLIQHQVSPSLRVQLRVSRDTHLSTAAGPLKLLVTPGHTADSITPVWGPFLFGGDTLMFGDTGRDDLPGGNPAAHWESIQKIKEHVQSNTLLLAGHDGGGGRVSNWSHQLKISPSLTQDQKTFVEDAGSYIGPSPKLLKESLFENFK